MVLNAYKAVKKHTTNKWNILYIERWLKTPMQMPDGSLVEKTKGTMQGGVVSPVLSNLFSRYVFDSWMSRKHIGTPWCGYADDGLVHGKTESEAKQLLVDLKARFEECGLELHPDKTKIIYCKDSNRKGNHTDIKFDFLGYTFRGRTAKNKENGGLFVSFAPAVSKRSLNAMRAKTREWKLWRKSDLELEDIAGMFNPILNGWLNYYGRFNPSALYAC
jgi:RNA-directed DNA polymerase